MNKYFWNMFTFLKVFRVSKYVYSNFSFNVFLASWQCWMLFLQSQHYLEIPFPPKISPILHEASRYLCFALCVQFVATVSECILELSRNIAWIIYRLWRISTACCLPAFWNCNVNVMVATVKKTLSFSIQEKHMSAVGSFWFSKCNALLWGMSELENRIDIDIKKKPLSISFICRQEGILVGEMWGLLQWFLPTLSPCLFSPFSFSTSTLERGVWALSQRYLQAPHSFYFFHTNGIAS